MPFVKRNTSSSQQMTHDLFVGRTGEQLFFVQNILNAEEPTHNILSISGQGGVGKSTLLARLRDETQTADWKDACLSALVDERQFTPVDIMRKFAEQLHIEGTFGKALRKYKEALQKQQRAEAEQETLQSTILDKLPDFTGAAAEGVPVVGPLLREGVKTATGHLLGRYHLLQTQREQARLENPIGDLTRAFVEELNRLSDVPAPGRATQGKRPHRILLFFDTFEQLAPVATPWLLDYFLQADISNQVVLIVAGRDPINYSTPDGPKAWLPYLDHQVIFFISLESFTEDETRTYLAERGITDADQSKTIWRLSGGLPLYLGLLTSNPQGRVDPTKDVVVNFLRWIPEQEPLKRQLALDGALLSRPFDQDDLEAFSYLPEADRLPLYQWLIGLPFVRSSPLDGRHTYHELVQTLFCRHLYQRSRKDYARTRKALADYYQVQMEKVQKAEDEPASTPLRYTQGRLVYRTTEWLELAMATAYQFFFLPERASQQKAMELILHAHEESIYTEEIIRALRQLIQGQPNNLTDPTARHSIKLLLRYVEADLPASKQRQELVHAADELLKTSIQMPSFSSELLAHVYRKRSFAYTRLGDYQRAIADCDRALELSPNYARAYVSRGSAHWHLGAYQQAIEDASRAIELEPDYVWAYTTRGHAYSLCKEYMRAIEDLSHAIEIGPEYAYAYLLRGYTYLRIGDSIQASADFARSWELYAKSRACWAMEWTAMIYEKPGAEKIQLLEDIARNEPEEYWAILCGGVALWIEKRFEDALALFEQAILLQPETADGYFWKGMACASLGEYTTAAEAIEEALKRDLPPLLLKPLRWFAQDQPDFYHKHAVKLLARYNLQ
ncbi:MAG TPA: tetratricopeptide repeat protein [Ktedonobacteraceae bacterium]